MAKKAATAKSEWFNTKEFGELIEELPRKVRKHRDECHSADVKSSDWFRKLADVAKNLRESLPDDQEVLRSKLSESILKSNDVHSAKPYELSGPIETAMKNARDQEGFQTTALRSIFDQLRKLVYPEEHGTRRSGSRTKDTVQEFERKLSDQEIEDITATMEWADGLSVSKDASHLYRLSSLSVQEMLLYLASLGYGRLELGRELQLPKSTVSRLFKGNTDPAESVAIRIREFLLNLPK